MAGLVKELYLDYSLNRLSIEERSDLSQAIELAYRNRLLQRRDIHILDMYLQGYTVKEIALHCMLLSEKIQNILTRAFIILEVLTGYTDGQFILRIQNKYTPAKIKKLEQFLFEYGRIYE